MCAHVDRTTANAKEETDIAKQRNTRQVKRDKDGESCRGTWRGEVAGAAVQGVRTGVCHGPYSQGKG